MGLFNNRTKWGANHQVPVWFMRQAGRYHSHYQQIRKNHTFEQMCKTPSLACEVTMGPMNEFGFDAAILFSDILYPLEYLGMGLSFTDRGPKITLKIETLKDLKQLGLKNILSTKQFFSFQQEALIQIKDKLPAEKDLLGFVGAPFTLYTYAVEGQHLGGRLLSYRPGLYDGRFDGFLEYLLPVLMENMSLQAEAGIDAICLFDTMAGELSPNEYKKFIIPSLKTLTYQFKKKYPHIKIIYYSKYTNEHHLHQIEDDNIDVLGVDWRNDLASVLQNFGNDYYIQGNIDPLWLHLEWNQLQNNLKDFFHNISSHNLPLDRWIMSLGHGIMIETPENNVKKVIDFIHNHFHYTN